jgi:secreted trypsin-like serine protease
VVAVGSSSAWHCSGVLVGRRAVLTARHCLPATKILFGSSIYEPTEVDEVVGIELPLDGGLDVALLRLARPHDIGRHPRRGALDTAPLSTELRHAGFGARDPSGQREFGFKHLMSTGAFGASCENAPAAALCDHTRETYVAGNGGRDTCDGDSGGPLFERIASPVSAAVERWRLAAITSHAVTDARDRCGDGGVYVRAEAFAPWLDEILKDETEGNR